MLQLVKTRNFLFQSTMLRCLATYKQGQSPEPMMREYFYYIDHEGQLFLDDAKMKNFTSSFKDKAFLKFFYKRLNLNTTERYRNEFPFISLCRRERNFVRCDDSPIVFTHVFTQNDEDKLAYGHVGLELSVPFEPRKIYVEPTTGRVYHPAWPQVGNIGLVRSKLAIEFSEHFEFNSYSVNSGPTHFTWSGKRLLLENAWVQNTNRMGMFDKDKETSYY